MIRPSSETFLLARAFRGGAALESDAALESALQGAIARARAAWPALELPVTRFIAWLGEKLGRPIEAVQPLAALHLEDLALAFACAEGLAHAAETLDATHLRPLALELARNERSPSESDDVLQRLRERLLVATGRAPLIGQYQGRGPLAGWLRIAALRTLSNLRRAERPEPSGIEAHATPMISPELALLKARDRAALERAVREAFAALALQERNLLRLHFVEGLGLDRLARLFAVHRATAARWLAAARARLREEVLARIEGELRLSPAELQSWMGLVRSQLGVSVRQLLAEPKSP